MSKHLQLEITKPPIELESYFFPKILFEANHSVVFEDLDDLVMPEAPYMLTDVTQQDEEGKTWTILLGVKSDDLEENKDCCFRYEIQVFGLFHWVGKETTDEKETDFRNKTMAVSGASILYGAARDCLRTITAMGPFPRYILPTIQFSPEQLAKPQVQKKKTKKT